MSEADRKAQKKEVNNLLKQAKKDLMNENFDECISTSKSVLKMDKTNLLALIFTGKSLQAKKRPDEALKYYAKACEASPNDRLGWKGQLSVRVGLPDFVAFFDTLTSFAKVLVSNNDELTEVVIYIKDYTETHGLDFKPMKLYYLRQIIPGLSELGDMVGYQVAPPTDSLNTLIKMIEDDESKNIKSIKDKVKLTFSLTITEAAKSKKYNEKIWPVVSVSEIPELYKLLIDLEQNDSKRYKTQDNYLRYMYNLLLTAPAQTKESVRTEVRDIVEGLVLISCPSEFAWKLYFDWQDPTTLADLELEKLAKYIKLFDRSKGYGYIFYNFLISDVCPFDQARIVEYLKPTKKKRSVKKAEKVTDTETGAEIEPGTETKTTEDSTTKRDERYKIFDIKPQEILTAMSGVLPQVKTSIICCRIILDYAVHLRDYSLGLDISSQFTKATVNLKESTGLNISNSKLVQTLNLAIIYTYYEAPKNFPKALALYDSIEDKYPNNTKVKIGKALILVETKRYAKASEIFLDLIDQDPKNIDAIQEYGWCQIYLNNYLVGRQYLERAIEIFQSDEVAETEKSLSSAEILSTLFYRLAFSYYMEFDSPGSSFDSSTLKSMIEKCSSLLLQCLKLSPNYAPAFTTLGLIYYNYVGNKDRAIKSFYKAFQLDPAEIEASYKLVEHFTSIKDWEMADIICKAVIENDRARRELNSVYNKSKDNSWPYRILGCASMECKDDVKAIEYFQTALRINPLDVSSWLSLGEAYIARGRLEASIKVLTHVIKLQSGMEDSIEEITPEMERNADWHAVYLLAFALTSTLDFGKSVKMLVNLLEIEHHKDNLCLLTLLIETLVLRCDSEIKRGAILRASDTLLQNYDYLFQAFALEGKSVKLWKALGDSLAISLTIQSLLSKLPISRIYQLVQGLDFNNDELLADLNIQNYNIDDLLTKQKYSTAVHLCYTLSCIAGYLCSKPGDVKNLRSSLIYNIAVSLVAWQKECKAETFTEVSIKLLNKAIALESDNADYWNCLGIVSLNKNARISQHCFIKALSLESKSPFFWFNLGMLYIKYLDYELANECFIRAQSISPASSIAWIGQALIADERGDQLASRNLFTHSYVMSKGCDPSNTLLYAVSVFSTIMNENYEERDLDATQQLTTANYGMLNYLKLYPKDAFALELNINIIERLYSYDKGVEYSKKLCTLLEAEYEEEESEKVLINYCKAKCQLSRLLLARQEYTESYSVCEDVVSLLDAASDLTMEVQKCMMSCFTVMGLALYFKQDFERSLTEFKKLLEAFPENKRIVVLISQVLYASGETDAKQAAMDELLNSIETHGTSLIVSMTIAAISLVEEWQEYIVAVKEVLDTLPLDILISDTYREVPKLLAMIGDRLRQSQEKKSEGRVDKIWQRNAFLFTGDNTAWSHLDAELSLEMSINAEKMSAMEVADSYVRVGRIRETQRGILLSGGISPAGLKKLYNLLA
ncbi:hypothetical protein PMKS-002747 [Pichia membranifaciens]|uniref:Superkiller protein 3 n=1 Tax=Pichia membranifaciens TaxID=4926 RepID=A0A1Q2YIB8_9ASCO|nr:hypothetical protein PMKS-002747 [Pichia membranifaciens]